MQYLRSFEELPDPWHAYPLLPPHVPSGEICAAIAVEPRTIAMSVGVLMTMYRVTDGERAMPH